MWKHESKDNIYIYEHISTCKRYLMVLIHEKTHASTYRDAETDSRNNLLLLGSKKGLCKVPKAHSSFSV